MKRCCILLLTAAGLAVGAARAEDPYERTWSFAAPNARPWVGAEIREKALSMRGTGLAYIPTGVSGIAAGRRFVFSSDLQGKGTAAPGAILIAASGKRSFRQGAPIVVEEAGTRMTYEIDLSRECDVQRLLVSIRFTGELQMKQAKLVESPLPGDGPRAVSKFAAVRRGDPVPDAGFDGDAKNMTLLQIPDGAAPTAHPGICKLTVSPAAHTLIRASIGGRIAEVSRCVFAPSEYEELDTAAKKIRLAKPLSVLYLGDSLTDFRRGHNHADLTAFWLEKYNPGRVTMTNAAVHGDYLGRVLDRLTQRRGTFKQFRYNDLWSKKYDLIFIWLGHNDTVARKTDDPQMRTPRVSPEAQRTGFARLLQEIRRHSDARIVLVSASPLNPARCREIAEKNHLSYRFGTPELIAAWNAELKQIAATHNVGLLDVYPPLQIAFGQRDLTEDGCHFSQEGHRVTAAIFLREFPRILKNLP